MIQRAFLTVTVLLCAPAVLAHGIAGNRLFPGTIAFDDPATATELQLYTVDARRDLGGEASPVVRDRALAGSFQHLLLDDLALVASSGGIFRTGSGLSPRAGFDQTSLGLKQQLYKNELAETLVSASLNWGIGGSGSSGVSANNPNTLTPGITFGKGFGDLPDALAWLRPFGIAGAAALTVPLGGRTANVGYNTSMGKIGSVNSAAVTTLHWGFAVEYSTLYLTDRFEPGQLPKNEPLHQLVPLVEFAFDTPWRQKTAATVNPGLAYVEDVWQLSAEAIVPLNRQGGRSVGFRTQLLIFLDDFAPAIFGKPLLAR